MLNRLLKEISKLHVHVYVENSNFLIDHNLAYSPLFFPHALVHIPKIFR